MKKEKYSQRIGQEEDSNQLIFGRSTNVTTRLYAKRDQLKKLKRVEENFSRREVDKYIFSEREIKIN